ncbi:MULTISPECIES: tetracycline resistance MFS efflux pump [Desulfitobacterium]|uniref:Arabinose efflux permease family protein n=1 Tax=Desulfitobacterium dehalogenans (strain ATCC 51507 / DSM 9161 / JW/IU-DC1) TaxID=756499 RepID=I4AAM3_DESDJ|nr:MULTISPECIES: tetracycline resistance MFS efflux pump [Desulfitobacterium]AFM01008.1 arabinose efflux permease family protein [Desulfitobacterium dehalogenans ATCC 51507]
MQKQYIRPMVILVIIQFLVMVGFGVVIPILPFLIGELGGGAFSLGLFMSAYSIMQFFFAPFWGRLSDRIGRRPVLLIGLSGYGITFFLYGMAGNLPLLIAFRALSGMVSSATLPTAMAYMADITEGAERSKSMGMLGAAMGLGMVFGPALGGSLGHYSFTLPFYFAGTLALLILPFAWKLLPETLKEPNREPRKKVRLNFGVIRDPLFPLFVFSFVLSFTMAMFETTFTLFAAERVGFGPKEMGFVFMIIGIVGVIVQGMLIGKVVKRFGDAKPAKFGAVLCALAFLWMLWAPNAILLVLGTVVFMTGNSFMTPTSSSLVSKNSHNRQGASLGVFQSFGSLGRILGPLVGGGIYGLSMNTPYIIGMVTLVLCLILFGSKIQDRKADEAESSS